MKLIKEKDFMCLHISNEDIKILTKLWLETAMLNYKGVSMKLLAEGFCHCDSCYFVTSLSGENCARIVFRFKDEAILISDFLVGNINENNLKNNLIVAFESISDDFLKSYKLKFIVENY